MKTIKIHTRFFDGTNDHQPVEVGTLIKAPAKHEDYYLQYGKEVASEEIADEEIIEPHQTKKKK